MIDNRKMVKDILNGENVRLRAVEPGDVDFIYLMENDPAIWHVGDIVVPFSRFQIEQYANTLQHNIFADKQLRLIIELKETSLKTNRIGAIDLYDYDPLHRRAGIGILIVQQERNKGYASDSLNLLIRYSFEILMLHQLYCSISQENIHSIHLFEKHGFSECGIKKEWRLKEGKWTDEIMFQLINIQKY